MRISRYQSKDGGARAIHRDKGVTVDIVVTGTFGNVHYRSASVEIRKHGAPGWKFYFGRFEGNAFSPYR